MRRGAGIAAGLLLLVVGLVWTLQGAGVLGGSFMTGQKMWLGIGLVCVAAGGALLWRVAGRKG